MIGYWWDDDEREYRRQQYARFKANLYLFAAAGIAAEGRREFDKLETWPAWAAFTYQIATVLILPILFIWSLEWAASKHREDTLEDEDE